jgi:Zn-dependent M28 family amino/carboxypeptidase
VPATERNVLANVRGETDEIIVVCAHHDSAWRAGGAVDNASGVEALRRIVERYAKLVPHHTLLAIAFGAEELGLAGSRFFVHDTKTRGELTRIRGVVNLECLARGDQLELWAAPDSLRARGLRIAAELGPDRRSDDCGRGFARLSGGARSQIGR